MQLSTFVTIAAVLLAYPPNLYAQETTLSSSLPPVITATGNCATITTQGSDCPTLSTCIVPACLKIESVTLSCGCESIFTSTTCETACPTGCAGTSYSTHVLPCSTTPPTSTPSTSTPDTSTTSSEPTTTQESSPTIPTTTYRNSTITTRKGPTPTTSASPTFTNTSSAKKRGSDSVLSGLMVAILGLLYYAML